MDKYYTPAIEEFHSGFEYEIMIPEKSSWSKEVFYLNESHIRLIKFVELQDEFTKNKIRVKYLDKADIESLNIKDYNIILNSGFVDIWRKHDSYPMVRGIRIKNKSKLKKLLRWLNISV